ncbi:MULTISPECIES: MFS transporter [Brevibacterium]|uniref:Major facilitator superfamily protein n=4 Tax=Actinomycetes TaxID=1760 RepID=K9AQK5_9MICO|nr:MFS transporter [Brevibacterium casei]NJE66301.1 MFS transporter [Brevibacterium sp. LS14]EKU48301.1 major facilitator superfamily protein [Brevibacterium casei S18]KZE21530.1 MFS transporter [Brevibacterium casei]MCT2358892.1 MFS transporter [Brevibacterium casei]PAK96761.1 MFS transporter [Brevibacterium casei]
MSEFEPESRPRTQAGAGSAEKERGRRRSMLVAAFGTVVEWYDFSIFFYVATTLTKEFFGGQADSLLLTLGVGAAGFLFRPLGAMVFGHLGDRVGRKHALVVSAVLMAVSMLGIAIMPDYNTIGIWAGVGLVFFRCLSGFSVGAEYTGIMVFLMESAKPGKRGLAASWAAANSEVGALLAVGSGALLANTLSTEAMESWGWRVLFVLGAVLAALMVPLRRMMVETDTFKRLQKAEKTDVVLKRSPLITAILEQPRAIIVAFLISSIGSVSYFLNITYVPTYVEEVAQVPNSGSLALGTVAAVVAIVVTPFFGLASDRFGRKASLAGLMVVFIFTTIPAYVLLSNDSASIAIGGAAFLAIPAAGWSAVAAAMIPEQFTGTSRFSGMAIGYNVATVLFGGLSPLVATWLMSSTGLTLAPAIYATVIVVVAGVPVLFLARSMAKKSLAEIDEDRHLVPA